jgi:anaerobic magnesium-protoporphyrin IX monomethyl ester cyclase
VVEKEKSKVTYGVATAHLAAPRDRAVVWMRARARQLLRLPTRTLLAGLCRLDRAMFDDATSREGRSKSRVAPRTRAAAPSTLVSIGSAPAAPAARPVASAARPLAATRDRPRILLLNPPRYRGIPVSRFYRSEYLFVDEHAIPATDLAYFAAAAAGKADVCLVEANAEDLAEREVLDRVEEFRPDVIVLKGLINVLEHDLSIPLAYKRRHPHVKVVLCSRSAIGAEAQIFDEFPLLDGIARGEVDAFARDIAEHPDLAGIHGMSTPGQPAHGIRVVEDLDEHPIPAFEQMPRVWYRGAMSGRRTGFSSAYYGIPSGYYLITSRGCPYTCTYCMTGGIHGRPFRFRKRDPENVVEECRRLWRYGIRDFYIFDEIFTMPGHAEPVCEGLLRAGLRVHFVCDGKPDLVTAPMLKTMKRAGCLAIYYGVESGDDDILRHVEKGHTAADARRAISLTREAEILAGAYAMLGFPTETYHTVLRTVEFLLQARPDMVRYNFLMPYPVTVMHAEMVAAGLLRFERKGIDRRINSGHAVGVSHRSVVLSPVALKTIDSLFRLAFATELARSPALPTAAHSA